MSFHKHSSGCLGRKGFLQGHVEHRFLKFLRSGIAAAWRAVFYHTNRGKSPNQSSALTVCTEHMLSKWTLQTQGEKKKSNKQKAKCKTYKSTSCLLEGGAGGRGACLFQQTWNSRRGKFCPSKSPGSLQRLSLDACLPPLKDCCWNLVLALETNDFLEILYWGLILRTSLWLSPKCICSIFSSIPFCSTRKFCYFLLFVFSFLYSYNIGY